MAPTTSVFLHLSAAEADLLLLLVQRERRSGRGALDRVAMLLSDATRELGPSTTVADVLDDIATATDDGPAATRIVRALTIALRPDRDVDQVIGVLAGRRYGQLVAASDRESDAKP